MTRTDPAIHTNKRTTQWKKDDLTIELRMAELKATGGAGATDISTTLGAKVS